MEGVPQYQELLDFIDLRAQASETSLTHIKKPTRPDHKRPASSFKPITSFAAQHASTQTCIACKVEKHPLYVCPKFKSINHEEKLSLLKEHKICMNCLTRSHFIKQCKSLHRCRKCQSPHHTLLHLENTKGNEPTSETSNAAIPLKCKTLLMTCRILVSAPDGTSVEARALLDNASSASFVSERLAQSLRLPRVNQAITVSGIVGLKYKVSAQSVASFQISPTRSSEKTFGISAIVVPKVTCDLPLSPVPFDLKIGTISLICP